jgi:Fe-S-cluster containining protein
VIPQRIPGRTCMSCKGCCRFLEKETMWAVRLCKDEPLAAMAAGEMVIPPSVITKDFCLRLEPSRKGAGYVCACLEEVSGACQVYRNRPLECQLYPFLLCAEGKKRFLGYDPHCPYMHEHEGTGILKEYAAAIVEALKTPQMRLRLKENPHLFQEYKGVVEVAVIDV